jgi:aliphatic nitrilase
MRETIRLAAVQAAPVWLDREATAAKACALIEEAGAHGAQLVGFPENFLPGHPVWYNLLPVSSDRSRALAARLFAESVVIPGPEIDLLCRSAARANINVVMGLTEKKRGTTGTMYNTQLFIDSLGHIVGKHQKLVATTSERLVHAPGSRETQRSFRSELGVISSLICGENSNPLAIARIAADYPLVHVASWPSNFWSQGSVSMRSISQLCSRSVAFTCGCFVIASASVNSEAMISALAGTAEEQAFMRDPDRTGGSSIIDPTGQVVAGPMAGDQEGIIYADATLEECIRARMVHDHAGHYNRSDVYQLLVNNEEHELVMTTGPAEKTHTVTPNEAAERDMNEVPEAYVDSIDRPDAMHSGGARR